MDKAYSNLNSVDLRKRIHDLEDNYFNGGIESIDTIELLKDILDQLKRASR